MKRLDFSSPDVSTELRPLQTLLPAAAPPPPCRRQLWNCRCLSFLVAQCIEATRGGTQAPTQGGSGMLRVLLPPSQPGRRQFQYSLPALFCNAAGDDGPGAAAGSTLTVGGHQDNTVWVKPQRVAAWHAQLRLKLSPEAAAGGGSPGSPGSSSACPSP